MSDSPVGREFHEFMSKLSAERQKDIVHITISDRDSQHLAAGDAILDTPSDPGLFEPQPEVDIPTERAATIMTPDGKIRNLEDLHKCPLNPLHYHFRTKRDS